MLFFSIPIYNNIADKPSSSETQSNDNLVGEKISPDKFTRISVSHHSTALVIRQSISVCKVSVLKYCLVYFLNNVQNIIFTTEAVIVPIWLTAM